MKLSKLIPPPLRQFVRDRMTVFVYTYQFRPSPVIEEQTLKFRFAGRQLAVTANHRTPLYDTILEVVDYDCYQLRRIQWDPSRPPCIVDIGANVGVSALVLSQIPQSHITCYEPDPENCTLLRRNLQQNNVTNVQVFEAAVADINGTLKFQTYTESVGGHLLRADSATDAHPLIVTAVNLDRVLEQCGSHEVDLIKCDCEGGEYALIDQMTPEHADRIRNLSIEVHDLDRMRNFQRISNKLSMLGYNLSVIADMWERSALHLVFASRAKS